LDVLIKYMLYKPNGAPLQAFLGAASLDSPYSCQQISQKPQGTQTLQHGPSSPEFHRDEVGLMSLLMTFCTETFI